MLQHRTYLQAELAYLGVAHFAPLQQGPTGTIQIDLADFMDTPHDLCAGKAESP